jgi:membrane protein DedA with SNARE-associated domain
LTEDLPSEPAPGDDRDDVATPPRPRPSRTVLAALVAPIIVLVICGYVADALTTTWADRHPLLLILLSSRNRILVLTTNQLDAFSYYAVAGLRLLLSDPLFYLIGFYYGDAAVRWVERRSSTYGEQLRWFEKAFKKASYPLVFFAPNNIICLFAGASGMPVPQFFAVNVAGTAFRLYLIRRLGETFDQPIDDVLHFFSQYRWPLLILSIALVALTLWTDRRKGGGEIKEILDLEREIESGSGSESKDDA